MGIKDIDYNRTGITSDDSVPTGATSGVDTTGYSTTYSEVAWFLLADSESDTCTVVPWYKHGDNWYKGTSQDVIGSSVVMGYSLSEEMWLQLTSVTGTWAITPRLVEKTA